MKQGLLAAIGFAAFTFLQLAWSAGHSMLGWKGAWVMKAAGGIGAALVLFVALGVFAVAFRFRAAELMKRLLALLGGAIVAMVGALLVIGPGNLWPMVIVFDTAIIGGAALFGGVIGGAIGRGRAA